MFSYFFYPNLFILYILSILFKKTFNRINRIKARMKSRRSCHHVNPVSWGHVRRLNSILGVPKLINNPTSIPVAFK